MVAHLRHAAFASPKGHDYDPNPEFHLAFAMWIARKWRGWATRKLGTEADIDDLFGYAQVGLVRAAKTYDRAKGFKFCTYAKCWIEQAIRRGVMNMLGVGTGFDVAQKTDLARGKTLTLPRFYNDSSYEKPGADDGSLTPCAARATTDNIGALDAAEDILPLLDTLPKRERDILYALYFQNQSLADVGVKYGFSRQRVSQIEQKALATLRARAAGREKMASKTRAARVQVLAPTRSTVPSPAHSATSEPVTRADVATVTAPVVPPVAHPVVVPTQRPMLLLQPKVRVAATRILSDRNILMDFMDAEGGAWGTRSLYEAITAQAPCSTLKSIERTSYICSMLVADGLLERSRPAGNAYIYRLSKRASSVRRA